MREMRKPVHGAGPGHGVGGSDSRLRDQLSAVRQAGEDVPATLGGVTDADAPRYTLEDLASRSGLSVSVINTLVRDGVFEPARRGTHGRRYSTRNLLYIRALAVLHQAGIGRSVRDVADPAIETALSRFLEGNEFTVVHIRRGDVHCEVWANQIFSSKTAPLSRGGDARSMGGPWKTVAVR